MKLAFKSIIFLSEISSPVICIALKSYEKTDDFKYYFEVSM